MKKVIIIEDSPTFCNMLGKKLEAKGWETILCYNYRDGLKAVRESSEWDVVISDMRLGNDERYRWKSRKALAMLVFPEQSSKILFVAKSFPSSSLIFHHCMPVRHTMNFRNLSLRPSFLKLTG